MEKWFRCFSEIPGIKYTNNPNVRPLLPEQSLVPRSASYEIANAHRGYLIWPMLSGTGITSASPAKQWITQPRKGETPAHASLRHLYESLELPGELLDYHFLIQGCCSVLWRLRREEPFVLTKIEQLCWLDIQLIQAYPSIIQVKNEQGFLTVTMFQHLLSLYEQEGYLFEALRVAEIAVKFHQQMPALERIKSRVVNLEAEGTY